MTDRRWGPKEPSSFPPHPTRRPSQRQARFRRTSRERTSVAGCGSDPHESTNRVCWCRDVRRYSQARRHERESPGESDSPFRSLEPSAQRPKPTAIWSKPSARRLKPTPPSGPGRPPNGRNRPTHPVQGVSRTVRTDAPSLEAAPERYGQMAYLVQGVPRTVGDRWRIWCKASPERFVRPLALS